MAVMNDIVSRRSVDGCFKLAIRFPRAALRGAGAAMSSALTEEGRLVPERGSSVPWRFESVLQDEEGALILGPDFLGRSLDEARGIEEGMPLLLRVARALAALAADSTLPRGIVSSGLLVSDRGDVLALPPNAIAKALSASGAESRAAAVARVKSPLSTGSEADASFLLAQATYRIASGKNPFEREAGEAGGTAGTGQGRVPTGLAAPQLDLRLAGLVDRTLADPTSVRLSEWLAALEAAAEAWKRELSSAEAAELGERRVAFEAGALAAARRATFFRKKGGILIAAAVAAVALALIGGDIARADRDKPNFSILAPRELARRYYQAVDALDIESLEACGDKKVIKIDEDYMTNLFVITKSRIAYEGKSPVVRAADWVAAGRPALDSNDLLYGIAALSLSGAESYADKASVSIRAEYDFWIVDRKEDPSADPIKALPGPILEKRVDELRLVKVGKGKKGWQITGLDRRVQP
jgi:hypothetical protein